MTREKADEFRDAYFDMVIGKPIGSFHPFSKSLIYEVKVEKQIDDYYVILRADDPDDLQKYVRLLLTYLEENDVPIDREYYGLSVRD